jgi:hypothetical protein
MQVVYEYIHTIFLFTGTGCSVVDDGPFAGFVTDTNPLKRKMAEGKGRLIPQGKIDEILQNCGMGVNM